MSGCSSSTSNSRATANSDDSECVKLCGRQRRRLQRQHPRQQNDRRVFLPSHCNDTPTGFFRIGTSSGLWRWRIGKTSLSSFSTSERLGCIKSLGSSLSSHLPQIRVHQALHQRVRPVYAELAVDEQKLHNVVEPLIIVEGGFLARHGADNALQDPSVVFASCHDNSLHRTVFRVCRIDTHQNGYRMNTGKKTDTRLRWTSTSI